MSRRNVCANACERLGKKEQPKTVARTMELRFREAAAADISRFVAGYVEGFFELYSDTGIWSEEIILQSIRSNGKKLFYDLYDAVELRLSARRILGRKQRKRGWQESRFHVGTRLVIVSFSEDRKAGVRYVEAISIDRKPIIF